MNEPTLDILTQRLDRLEREVCWWRWFGVVALVVVGALGLLGAANTNVPDEIKAKRFVLIGGDGRSLAELVQSFGEPYFALYGRDGKGRLVLHLVDDLPQVGFFDKDTRRRIGQGLEPGFSTPRLTLLDEHGKSRVSLSVSQNGPGLALADESERPRMFLASLSDGTTSLTFYDQAKPRLGLGVAGTGFPGILFRDQDGKVIWKAP